MAGAKNIASSSGCAVTINVLGGLHAMRLAFQIPQAGSMFKALGQIRPACKKRFPLRPTVTAIQ